MITFSFHHRINFSLTFTLWSVEACEKVRKNNIPIFTPASPPSHYNPKISFSVLRVSAATSKSFNGFSFDGVACFFDGVIRFRFTSSLQIVSLSSWLSSHDKSLYGKPFFYSAQHKKRGWEAENVLSFNYEWRTMIILMNSFCNYQGRDGLIFYLSCTINPCFGSWKFSPLHGTTSLVYRFENLI